MAALRKEVEQLEGEEAVAWAARTSGPRARLGEHLRGQDAAGAGDGEAGGQHFGEVFFSVRGTLRSDF